MKMESQPNNWRHKLEMRSLLINSGKSVIKIRSGVTSLREKLIKDTDSKCGYLRSVIVKFHK